ncbi:hypothetical protein QA635_06450 [Bradyrhizobium brasilense]|uniref:hypothetical protein n=1 Tax=Bradyrhizobium brasilense TaxID=1419277 RepID=UPI0024B0BD36|nr:hypothetical protein [Bradyrhizobium australafricanum]WFU34076.1 hypothetical protein QA635_06450 [Bradyrhizobium australafricanum]
MADDDSETLALHERLWALYDEIVMLLATDLGLDANELTGPVFASGEWTLLLQDLIAKASPITNPRVTALLKEYDELEKPLWDAARTISV